MGSRRLDDAIELVAWYERLNHCATTLNDNQIALELGWTRGGARQGTERKGKEAPKFYGDAGRVRAARRYVDHDTSGLFEGINFGSRENGGGRSLSRLHRRYGNEDLAGTRVHAAAEVGRALQMIQQHESERDRRILPTLRELADKLKTDEAPLAEVLAMHDVIRDMEMFGRIQGATQWALIKAGIKWSATT